MRKFLDGRIEVQRRLLGPRDSGRRVKCKNERDGYDHRDYQTLTERTRGEVSQRVYRRDKRQKNGFCPRASRDSPPFMMLRENVSV